MASRNSTHPGGRLLSPIHIGASILLSVGVMVLIAVLTFEPSQFDRLVDDIHWGWVAAACSTVVLRVLVGGWRLSHVSHGHLRLSDGIRAQLAWDFFSNVSPSAIGGGPVAAFYIARDRRIPLGQATALMLFTILLDQILFAVTVPLLLISALFLDVFPESLGAIGEAAFALLFVGIMGWIVLVVYGVLVRPDLLQRTVSRIFRLPLLRRFQDRVADEMEQLRQRATLLRKQPARFFAAGLGMTVLVWISRFLLPVFIILSVFESLDSVLAFARTIALSVGASVLPTPGGSGGIEGLYALFLGPLMPATLVAPTLLAWRVLGYYLFIALGVYLSMHQVRQSIRRRRSHARVEPVPAIPALSQAESEAEVMVEDEA